MQKVKMIAQGRVQGVGFRWGVYSLALEIGGITGRVWTERLAFWPRQSLVAKWPNSSKKFAKVLRLLRM